MIRTARSRLMSMALAASIALAPLAAIAQTYPTNTPTYIPSAILAPTTLAAPGDVTFSVRGVNTVSVRVQGTCTALAAIIRGTNQLASPTYTTLQAIPAAGGSIVTSITGAGMWVVNTAGLVSIQFHATVLTASCTVAMVGSFAPAGVVVMNPAALTTAGIDQGTPGTTNGVALVGVNAATALAGNGATGTGSQRVTLANDNTVPTGWPTGALQTTGNDSLASIDAKLAVGPYPAAATPLTGNAAGTTGAVVGTIAAAADVTTYICGFNVSAIGGTAPVGPITVAGLVGSSQVYQGSATAAGGVVAGDRFSPCIPASAVNTAITITTTANGTATAVNVNSWGYRQ